MNYSAAFFAGDLSAAVTTGLPFFFFFVLSVCARPAMPCLVFTWPAVSPVSAAMESSILSSTLSSLVPRASWVSNIVCVIFAIASLVCDNKSSSFPELSLDKLTFRASLVEMPSIDTSLFTKLDAAPPAALPRVFPAIEVTVPPERGKLLCVCDLFGSCSFGSWGASGS